MNITTKDLITKAKAALNSDHPYGEVYYKGVECCFNSETNRVSFKINYKAASKATVEAFLKTI